MRTTFALPVLLIASAAAIGCTPEESTSSSGDNTPPLESFAIAFDHQFADAKIASGPSGDLCLGGTFDGTFNFGGGDLTASAPDALFFAHLDADGGHLMSGSTGAHDRFGAVAVGPDSACFAAGTFDGSVNFGVGKMTADHAGFVTRFNGDGTTEFARTFVNSYQTDIDSIAALPNGGVVIAARTDDNVDFGNSDVSTGLNVANVVVAAYDKSGTFQWEVRLVASLIGLPMVAADKDGNVFFTGSTYSDFVIGNDFVSAYSMFITKLDPSGAPLWTKKSTKDGGNYGSPPEVQDISVDDEGSVYVAGDYTYTTFAISGVSSSPDQSYHAYLVKLDGAGKGVYLRDFPVTSNYSRCVVAGAKNGEALLGVTAFTAIDFGGGSVGTDNNMTGYLARFDAKGNHMKSVALGGGLEDYVDDLAADKDGNPLIVGRFQNSIRLNGKTLFDKGVTASYLARTKL